MRFAECRKPDVATFTATHEGLIVTWIVRLFGKVLKWTFPIIGAVAVLAGGALLAIRHLFPDEGVKWEYVSPGGLTKAVAVIKAGGGGFSPYCTLSIYVVPSSVEADAVGKAGYSVFDVDCATTFPGQGQVR